MEEALGEERVGGVIRAVALLEDPEVMRFVAEMRRRDGIMPATTHEALGYNRQRFPRGILWRTCWRWRSRWVCRPAGGTTLEKIIALGPAGGDTAPYGMYKLGMDCFVSRDHDQAKAWLERLVRLYPRFPVADSARRILATLAATPPGGEAVLPAD